MPVTSPNLALPYLMTAQAQKHVTHNEALERLDALAQLVVEAFGVTDPPVNPGVGLLWAVGGGPSGEWAGRGGKLALRSEAGWIFIQPREGWLAWGREEEELRIWRGNWQSLPMDGIDALGIATTADAENRLSVVSPASLFSHAGAGHQMKINKAAAAQTASLLFQSNWSGRAEMGLAGNDDFSIKVSPDGSAWAEALRVSRSTAVTTLPAGALLAPGTAAEPGLAFVGDPDTGLFRAGADQIGFATAGGQRALLSAAGWQINVPVTGTAVNPVSDSLANLGGLVQVGMDSGLIYKGRITAGSDLNSYYEPGIWAIRSGSDAAATLNVPAAVTGGVLEVLSPDTIRARGAFAFVIQRYTQRAHAGGAGYPRVWMRQNNSSTAAAWGPWVEQVSLVEAGSNANGEYRRYSDGRQECGFQVQITPVANTPTAVAWPFPAGFAVAPRVLATPNTTLIGSQVLGVSCSGATATRCDISIYRINTTVTSVVCRAVGRWF